MSSEEGRGQIVQSFESMVRSWILFQVQRSASKEF